MDFDFPLILFILVFGSGIIWLFDHLFLLPGRRGACGGTLVLRHHETTHSVHRERHEKARCTHHQPSRKIKA